jgi:hypothetical protein
MRTLAIGTRCSPDCADFYDRGVPYQLTGLLRTADEASVIVLRSPGPRRIAVDSPSLVETIVTRRLARAPHPN